MTGCGNTKVNLFLEDMGFLYGPSLLKNSQVSLGCFHLTFSPLSFLGVRLALFLHLVSQIPPAPSLFPSCIAPALYPHTQISLNQNSCMINPILASTSLNTHCIPLNSGSQTSGCIRITWRTCQNTDCWAPALEFLIQPV